MLYNFFTLFHNKLWGKNYYVIFRAIVFRYINKVWYGKNA